jgi:predicted HAD superfamily Cof-like phosphohydrolase
MPTRESYFAAALAEFHGHPNSILDDRTNGIPLRRTLIEEEAAELLEAIDEGDVEHIAREMADVLYVVWGTALVYGIDLDAAFREVHRAAMDKMRAGLRREDGKILKPPGFRPPDMTAAIAAAVE